MDYFHLLENCTLCPRKCGVNRAKGELGFCQSGVGYYISSICIHLGEEPPISGSTGICNVFFNHCNLQCVYCQNHQISSNVSTTSNEMTLDEILEKIISILDQEIPSLGFVSPTQFLPQVMAIIEGLHQRNYHPVIVWNSNGYELPEMIKLLDKHIDIFLPDFKYSENILAQKYSDAPDYPTIAMEALKTMLFLRGPRLLCDDEGSAYRGILIRHLVLPDHTENSLRILKLIAEELSPTVSLSLMSQYYPTHHASDFPEIDKSLKPEEYSKIVQEATRIGFTNLWLQEMDSEQNYRPDFNKIRPFE